MLFFFKQNTAYELRISDWSSDVCSSDLATLGVPIAMWADRGNRRNIITLALTIFSSMTVVCGFVTNFAQLALARIGVGVGEAGSSPPAHSMIADMFQIGRASCRERVCQYV